jgi:hypothetical protein
MKRKFVILLIVLLLAVGAYASTYIASSFMNVDTINPDTTNTITFTGNIDIGMNNLTNINELSASDGSMIGFSAPSPFSGFDQAITIITNQSVSGGVVTHALLDKQGGKVIEAWQSGKNNSAGFHRNSQLIFSDQSSTNASFLTDALAMWAGIGISAEYDYNTADQGATLGVQYGIETQKFRIHDTLGLGELNGEGSFRWISRAGEDFDIYEGPVHILDVRNENVTTGAGNIDIFDFTFDAQPTGVAPPQGGWSQISTTGSSAEEWSTRDDTACFSNPCIRAKGGDGLAKRIIEYNFTSENVTAMTLSFYYGSDNMDTGTDDNFSVTLNNNEGSGEVLIWNDTTTNADISTAILKTFSVPTSMNNKSSVSLRFYHQATLGIEESFADEIMINGTLGSATTQQVVKGDAKIELGSNSAGTDSIFYNGSTNNISISTIAGSYTGGEAYVCVKDDGTIFAKETACS